jgi:ribosomal protein S12 methylthiotransferase
MVSLGCPKNLTESESILGMLASSGYVPTSFLQDAEIIIINTCAFIRPAVRESLEVIARCARYKKSGSCRCLAVIGCLPQRYGKALGRLMPGVDLWLGANARAFLIDAISGVLAGQGISAARPGKGRRIYYGSHGGGSYDPSFRTSDLGPRTSDPPRLLSTPPSTAYLKIAEGCSHACSYCLIPKLRGRLNSRPPEAVCREAAQLVAHGVREIVLVAQDTGEYGRDLYGKPALDRLIRRLVRLPALKWLRIMYLNPLSLTGELLAAIQEEEKVCRYLDLPFQHANAGVLRRMRRKGDLESNLRLVADLRRLLPGVTLRTTLMTGFPGEDEAAFQELLEFVGQARFERLGVFTYWHEEGTRSYRQPETVSFALKQQRRRRLLELQRKISGECNRELVGRTLPVLIERALGDGVYLGRSFREAPEVDPGIIVRGGQAEPGSFVDVRITHAYTFDLAGKMQP